MTLNLVYNPLIPCTKERAVFPAVITRDCKMAASSHNEDLCLPGVYIFPITLKQCQLNTGCCCKTNHYCCSYPCLAGTSNVGAEQHSSLLQQLVQQQGISSQPLLPPCSSVPACWLLPHAAHSSVQVDVQPAWSWAQQKPGDMKVWSAASEAVPASPRHCLKCRFL